MSENVECRLSAKEIEGISSVMTVFQKNYGAIDVGNIRFNGELNVYERYSILEE